MTVRCTVDPARQGTPKENAHLQGHAGKHSTSHDLEGLGLASRPVGLYHMGTVPQGVSSSVSKGRPRAPAGRGRLWGGGKEAVGSHTRHCTGVA